MSTSDAASTGSHHRTTASGVDAEDTPMADASDHPPAAAPPAAVVAAPSAADADASSRRHTARRTKRARSPPEEEEEETSDDDAKDRGDNDDDARRSVQRRRRRRSPPPLLQPESPLTGAAPPVGRLASSAPPVAGSPSSASAATPAAAAASPNDSSASHGTTHTPTPHYATLKRRGKKRRATAAAAAAAQDEPRVTQAIDGAMQHDADVTAAASGASAAAAAASPSSSSTRGAFGSIDLNSLTVVFSFLTTREFCKAIRVSKLWRASAEKNTAWPQFDAARVIRQLQADDYGNPAHRRVRVQCQNVAKLLASRIFSRCNDVVLRPNDTDHLNVPVHLLGAMAHLTALKCTVARADSEEMGAFVDAVQDRLRVLVLRCDQLTTIRFSRSRG